MYSLPLLNRSAGMEGERSFSSASNNSTANEDNEYVWDGFTHGDQLVATSNDDYYEDLELAARLGKTLLQKNKELDTLNYQLRCCNEEQSLEIEHMNKQLTWLREVNESKSRMFEQLDVNYQDLDVTNRKLKAESREWKERVTKCMNVCESQEDQIQSLKAEIESCRKMHDGKKARERMRRRTIHGCLPSTEQEEIDVHKFLERSNNFSNSLNERGNMGSTSTDEEVNALHEVIGNLRAQQVMDKRMIKELRKELEAIEQENQECCEKLQEEREMSQRLNRIIEEYDRVVYRQAFVAESTPNITAELTNNDINFSDRSDDEDESIARQHLVGMTSRLGVEKSSFQSPGIQIRTPLSQYLRIANSTPMKSISNASHNEPTCNEDPVSSHTTKNDSMTSNLCPGKLIPHNRMKTEPKNVSLVQELDTQYKTLLGKYEMLLQSIESERVASPGTETRTEISQNQTDDMSSFLTDSSVMSEVGSENISRASSVDALPEYKRLFRELFCMINDAKA